MRKFFTKSLFLSFVTFASIGAFLAYSLADNAPVTGSYGISHSTWSFSTGGNAGSISFDVVPFWYSGAQVFRAWDSVYLTGIFWMQTVGWLSFDRSPLELVAPLENVRDPWSLSGYVWSPNAWWISFNHGEPYASGVYFLPDSGLLIGQAWSNTLWWIPFGSVTSSWVQIATNEWFIGKVAVTGQIGWNRTFNVLYDVGWSFNTASMTSFLNVIRKNITTLMRNAGNQINTSLSALGSAVSFNGAMMFLISNNPSDNFLAYSNIANTFNNDNARSLIAIGTDIYIDTDVLTPPTLSQVRAIIALKNDAWQGWHIWIRGDVKKIEWFLFAEGTIWSGEDAWSGLGLTPYYVRKESLFLDMPPNQLYIKWGVWGYNTIWWGSKDGWAVCPYLDDVAISCTYDNAIQYDWNYFRVFRSWDAPRRSYPDDSRDEFSVIIEHDPRIIQDPPPWIYWMFN
jgi:hypothetical protein